MPLIFIIAFLGNQSINAASYEIYRKVIYSRQKNPQINCLTRFINTDKFAYIFLYDHREATCHILEMI